MGSLPPARERPLQSHGLLPFRRTLTASTTIAMPFADAKQVARTCLASVVAEAVPPAQSSRFGLAADIFMRRGARRLRVPVLVEVEGAYGGSHGAIAHLRWRSRHHRRLFPVMEADLLARPTSGSGSELVLHGTYHPPYGLLGLVGDLALGRVVARSTVQAFLEELGRAMEAAVAQGRCAVPANHPMGEVA